MTSHSPIDPRSPALIALALWGIAACGPTKMRPKPLEHFKPAASQPAAAADPWAGRDDLIGQPAPRSPSPLELPPLERTTLAKSGLKLLVLADPSLPLVNVVLLVKAGAIDDPSDKVGLASFTAQMLRQGTRRSSADALARRIEGAGASLQTSGGYELSSVSCGGRARSLALCLETVAELAQQPRFPKKELAQVRTRLEASVKGTFDDPSALAAEHFNNLLYGDGHPAGRPLSLESIRAITRADLVGFHKRHYVPSQALLVVSGAVDPVKTRRQVARLFRRWRGAAPPPRAVKPVRDPEKGLKVLLIDKPDLSQSFFALGHAGISAVAKDRDAVGVMNYILGGGGFSSRLMKVVRATGGKTYSISSSFSKSQIDGDFAVQSFTKNEQLPAMVSTVIKELERMRATPPTAAELAAAKGKIAGGYAIAFKTGTAVALALAESQLRGQPDSQVTERAVRVHRLAPKAIARAAATHLRPDRLVLAVVGKAAVVGPLLRKAGVAYEQIGHLEPISALARRRAKQRATTNTEIKVSPAQLRAARRLLDKALKVAGGRERVARIASLKLFGQTQGGKGISAPAYTLEISPPDKLRLGLTMGHLSMLIAVDGDSGHAQMAGGARKPLPPDKLAEMKAEIWRQPPLVLEHARRSERIRPAPAKGLARGQRGVELIDDGGRISTLLFDRRARLVGLRYPDPRGNLRSVILSDHKKVAGLVIPHLVSTQSGGQTRRVVLSRVEVSFR